jgi:hypothetical protein
VSVALFFFFLSLAVGDVELGKEGGGADAAGTGGVRVCVGNAHTQVGRFRGVQRKGGGGRDGWLGKGGGWLAERRARPTPRAWKNKWWDVFFV